MAAESLGNHSCHLLQQLHEQRIQGFLCDCMLVVKGVCFKAHKNVLAAFSQYFRTLFQNSSGQSRDVFHLDITNVGGIGQILDFMYTSRLDLSHENVQAVLDIAQCLQVPNVLSLCYTFLKDSANVIGGTGNLSATGAISLHGALTTDTEDLLENSNSAEINRDCSFGIQSHIHKAQELGLLYRPLPDISQAEISATLQNQTPGLPDRNSSDYPLRQNSQQPSKLYNCYGKEMFKQNQSPFFNNNQGEQRRADLDAGLSATVTTKDLSSLEHSECNTASQEPSSSGMAMHTEQRWSFGQGTANIEPQPIRQLPHVKKTIPLKKYDYMRSQKLLDSPSVLPKVNEATEAEKINELSLNKMPKENLSQGNGTGEKDQEQIKLVDPPLRGSDLVQVDCVATGDSEDVLDQSLNNSNAQSQLCQSQKQYCCELCGKTFKHPSNLELHRRSHTGEKPFECNICGKHFSQAGNLQTHLRRHSGEKPYICEICGKRFAASGDVQRHIVIHTGQKPHLCDICGRGFSNFSNLKEHKKTHSADKLFTCDQCGKSFNMQRKLVKHRIRHTGERPYNCLTCGKRFAGSGDLRRHVRTHTGERPYNCETCGKCFTRSAVLHRHKRMHCRYNGDHEVRNEEIDSSEENYGQSVEQNSPEPEPLSQVMQVALLPASPLDKLRGDPEQSSVGVTETSANMHENSHSEYNSLVQQQMDDHQNKMVLSSAKTQKPQASHQPHTHTVDSNPRPEESVPSQNPSTVRSSVTSLDIHINVPFGNHTPSVSYRTNEGPFLSSLTLWGLAMKTLQNDNELDQ
uniref:zinc finger and BTB domain-containing protein 49 isoform X1 n=2 Tax=Pristiophorus japonicus TaxID=55135 RepID=UPI00398F7FF9